MTDLALILIGALLVNNFVLAQFLGLCPFMGVTKGYDTALATGLATTFVLTLAAVLSYLLFHAVLVHVPFRQCSHVRNKMLDACGTT